MKINHPVTDREVLLKEGTTLISRTDIKGRITYVNDEFVEISGFTNDELVGSNHNIVRHPDMPPAAFADLWATLQAGTPWKGIVKNRCKNGDYYWVEANVIPINKNGITQEYLSVRYTPTREQIQNAEALYRRVVKENASLAQSRFSQKLSLITELSIKNKLIAILFLLLTPLLISLWVSLSDKNAIKEFASQELIGVEYQQKLSLLLDDLLDYSKISGQKAEHKSAELDTLAHETLLSVKKHAENISEYDAKSASSLKSSETWNQLNQKIALLDARDDVAANGDNLARTNQIITNLISLVADINDNSNLTLDPDLDSYWLMDASVTKLPELKVRLAQLRDYIAANYKNAELSDKVKIELMLRYKLAERLMDKTAEASNKAMKFNVSVAEALSGPFQKTQLSVKRYLDSVKTNLIDTSSTEISADKYLSLANEALESTTAFDAPATKALNNLLALRLSNTNSTAIIQVSIIIGFALFSSILAIYLIRYISTQNKKLQSFLTNIAEGNFKNTLELDKNDEYGILFRTMQIMQVQMHSDFYEVKNESRKNLILKQALDNVNSSVMVANNDRNIIYMNNSVKDVFNNAEADIRKHLPKFDASKMMGANIDQFHRNPAHQASLLSKLDSTFTSGLEIGGRHMSIVANPVKDSDGSRIGTVVEWRDRTKEVMIEQEIENIVDSVKTGNLSARINLSDKQGFFAQLSKGINELTEVIDNVFKDIASTMQSMSEGDLTNRITSDYQGVYLSCKEDINTTIAKLSEIFAQVTEAANFINNASQEIASGNNNLSQRAEQQAANLEETAASMEQLTSTVKNNAENAQQADKLASGARQLAEKGGDVVTAAVSAMREINESSNKIADIIGVIDEIAFQTNLLALNASVEAARAGEQGRGFSVVATEVRNLAQRSATAARESKDLIQTSVQKVRTGTEFVNETGKSLSEIVASVKKVGDIIAQIAAASVEQSSGIGQVNQAVSQMDEITQQNAALAQEASAASVSMSDLSSNMVDLLSFFKLEGQSSHGASHRQTTHVAPRAPESTGHIPAPFAKAGYTPSYGSSSSDDEWQDF